MLKVVVIGTRGFPDVQGGVENHCEKLYTHLAEKDCDITVFTRKPYVNPGLRKFKGVLLIPLECPKNKFLEAVIHTFKGVLEARKLNPDILHIHAIGPSLFAPFGRLLGMKVVVTSHGPDYRRKKWPLLARIFLRFCEWMGMTFANKIIAIAENIADDINKKFKRDAAVIPNGVEIPVPSDTVEILKKYGLKDKRYILAVGRFVPEKGFDYLIEAYNQCDFDHWKLVITGDADHEDKYSINLKAKSGRNGNIVLTGFLKGRILHELYSHAGLFVLPSYHEGLPIVLLEAMSYGLSCIASDIPANKSVELSIDRFFKAGDIESLKLKIKEFINIPWEKEDGKRQVDMMAENYNWEKIADETLKVYRQVIS